MPHDAVMPIPEDYTSATPCLTINGAAQAIDFYARAFGAVEVMRMPDPSGRLMHAEIRIGRAAVMLHDEQCDWPTRSPTSIGDTGSATMIYVHDVDRFVQTAVHAGVTLAMPVQTHFYGDRTASMVDPYGHKWIFATHVEDVPATELHRRAQRLFAARSTPVLGR